MKLKKIQDHKTVNHILVRWCYFSTYEFDKQVVKNLRLEIAKKCLLPMKLNCYKIAKERKKLEWKKKFSNKE